MRVGYDHRYASLDYTDPPAYIIDTVAYCRCLPYGRKQVKDILQLSWDTLLQRLL